MARLLKIIAVNILLALIILFVAVTVPIGMSTTSVEVDTEQLPYAVRGAYPVGVRNLVIEDAKALPLIIWYPAVQTDNANGHYTYPYQIKMGEPFGMVRFATYDGQAIEDATYDEGTTSYPLVILSPGFAMGASAYGWIAEHLASYGFVVIAPEHQEHFDGEFNGLWQSLVTRPQEILTVLDYVDEQIESDSAFASLIDADRVAVIGHSYGGYTTLAAAGAQIDTNAFQEHCQVAYEAEHPAAWLCDETLPHLGDMATLAGLDSVPHGLWQLEADPRIDAIIPIAGDAYVFGEPGLAEITIPVLAIGGTDDHDTPFDWGTQPTYDYVSSTHKAQLGLIGAEHMIFTGSCEAVPLLMRLMSDEFCSDGEWNRYHAHNIVKHFSTAFLLSELNDDTHAPYVLMPENVTLPDITYDAQGY